MADHDYRGFLIRSAMSGGMPRATVIAGDQRLAVVLGDDLSHAEANARLEVDQLLTRASSKRSQANVPSADEYIRYFQVNPPAPHEVAMLKAHKSAQDRALTATQLANAAGWTSFSGANAH